jgi:hypothetical protein
MEHSSRTAKKHFTTEDTEHTEKIRSENLRALGDLCGGPFL